MRPSRQVNLTQGYQVGRPGRKYTLGSSDSNHDIPKNSGGIDLLTYLNGPPCPIGAPQRPLQTEARTHLSEPPIPDNTLVHTTFPPPHSISRGDQTHRVPEIAVTPAEEKSRSVEAKRDKIEFRWPGDIADYPAEAYEELQLPGCEYRAKTVHVGRAKKRFDDIQSINVYAIRPAGAKDIEYRLAKSVWSPQEIIDKGFPIGFHDIIPSIFFEGMNQTQVELWVRQLLAQIPGQNDTVMKWTRGPLMDNVGGIS
ncbi:hypothetical protein F4775DRAFT_597907 [Biscogniauxia sp. FL1348]|nr:hypothetical protein F4775DRAFT_597907 [Biscogniauxia sp. FL1348]